MANQKDTRSKVEQAIDSILEGKTKVSDVVAAIAGDKALPESVTFGEGEDITCPQCGGTDFEEGILESDGAEYAALRCKGCELLLSEKAVDTNESEEDGELVEAEIDENDPHCPACGSDNLDGEIVESEGEQHVVITCGNCGVRMVAG